MYGDDGETHLLQESGFQRQPTRSPRSASAERHHGVALQRQLWFQEETCKPAVLFIPIATGRAVDKRLRVCPPQGRVYITLKVVGPLGLSMQHDAVEPSVVQPLLNPHGHSALDLLLCFWLLHVSAVQRLVEEELRPATLVQLRLLRHMPAGVSYELRQDGQACPWVRLGVVQARHHGGKRSTGPILKAGSVNGARLTTVSEFHHK
mmetsp:Transcript_61623/g.133410  ORF Transcript_61623/g.133410 Transcript_61623/m.133410 type:complete len:206 (+) Transcript_61623:258-875(+)